MGTRTISQSVLAHCLRWASIGGLCLTFAPAPAWATDGFYDPSFGSGGRHSFAMSAGPDQGQRLRILADGTLLIGGTCTVSSAFVACLAWYRGDGTDFNHNYGPGGSGKAFPNSFSGFVPNMFFSDMAVLPDGRVVLMGRYNDDCVLAIVRADGTDLDRSAGGGDGWTTCGLTGNGVPPNTQSNALALQTDGKVLVAGGVYSSNNNYDMAVVRLLPDLSGLDPNFFGASMQTVAFELGGGNDLAYAVDVQADGKILLAGIADTVTAFARLLPNGLVDNNVNNPGFGFGPLHDGRAHYAFGPLSQVSAILIDRSGRIVFGGNTGVIDTQGLVGRLVADGSAQDPTFNSGSAQQFLFLPGVAGNQYVASISRQSDGKILAFGSVPRVTDSIQYLWGEARLLANGSFDNSFGSLGLGTGTFTDASSGCCGYSDTGKAVAIGDGGIVFTGAGAPVMGGSAKFGIARVLLDLVFTDAFE
jgi:uncharacterized delta-60 repeat protein